MQVGPVGNKTGPTCTRYISYLKMPVAKYGNNESTKVKS